MKFEVKIDQDKCKGCGLCIAFCQHNSLKISKDLNRRGVKSAIFNDNGCIGCKSCAIVCPETCIEIEKI